tara:strand:+ start:20 stop:460 length:441 start_codon:yes stop_codon:yes gene_type:complete
MKSLDKDYYSYSRDDFIKRWKKDYDTPLNEEEIYDEDIESISTHIIQMKLGHIIYIDNDGKDIRNQNVIEEKNYTPFIVKKDSSGKYKFGFDDYEDWEKGMSNLDEKNKEQDWKEVSRELRQLISNYQKKIKKEKEQDDIINRKIR